MQGANAYNAIFCNTFLNIPYLINSFIACIIKISPDLKISLFWKNWKIEKIEEIILK